MFPRALFACFLLAGTLACSDKPDTDVDTGSPIDTGEVVSDADEDGYTTEQGDCDDTNAAINPEATETCNGVDDNCNDAIDEDAEDATTYYADADSDGWGDENATETACEQPSGHVAEPGDCNDADAEYHPGATEDDCTDPNDYNCDGSVGFEDADSDTHPACEDCDDSVAEINPDADEICDEIDNDCDEEVDEDATDAPTWYADSDGDGFGGTQFTETACAASSGFVDNSDDCDDLDASSYPGGTEVCDEADNNCDGTVDEGVGLTWYADVDGDGYGDVSATSEACDSPPGYVANANDCNDASATISPLALELCDTVDNDCDGDIDENDALDTSTWYLDSDSDGFGDANFPDEACDQPSGSSADNTDCDDAVATTYPGADELCDSVDNDCDGTTDEDDAVDAGTWYTDSDADGYGDANSATVSCTQPTGTVSDATDCDDTDNATSPGATEVCDGLDNNCDGTVPSDEIDGDGDGYPACEDCNDNYQSIRPGADEYCNGVDDDCDGTVDEGDAFDADTYYTDADGDGYGDPATASNSCTHLSGLVAIADDCDDTDASVSPLGTETCYDGIDSNCSGHTDNDCDEDGHESDALGGDDCNDSDSAVSPSADELCNSIDDNCDGTTDEDSATDATTWYLDSDSDGYGDANDGANSCSQISGRVDDATDCDDTDSTTSPGASESCDGLDNNCDGAVPADEGDADLDGVLTCEDCDDTDATITDAGCVVGSPCTSDSQCHSGYCGIVSDTCAELSGSIRISGLTEEHNGDLGGISGANSLCQSQAVSNGHSGGWVAMLATDNQSMIEVIPNVTDANNVNFRDDLPVVDLGGTTQLSSWNQLTSTSVIDVQQYVENFAGIDMDEPQGYNTDADCWSGAQTGGASSQYNCNNWTSSSSSESGMNTEIDFHITREETHSCNSTLAVLCVEVED